MKLNVAKLKEILPKLTWSDEELATNLSLIGHEAEVVSNGELDIKLTANRKDCQDLVYLAFDLAGIYEELGDNKFLQYQPGQKVPVNLERINKILGSNLNDGEYRAIERLGFVVENDKVTAPEFRVDITEAADIAEEVFRCVGVKKINIKMLERQTPVESPQYEHHNAVRRALVSGGATETKSVSFTSFGKVKLKNPFANTEPYLRANLRAGLLQTLSRNPFSRRNIFFEIGDVFDPDEKTMLGIVISGYKKPETMIQELSRLLGVQLHFSAVNNDELSQYSVKQPNVMLAECAVTPLKPVQVPSVKSKLPKFKTLSIYPPLVRDITVTRSSVDDNFVERIHAQLPALLIGELIDEYTDPQTGKTTDTYRLIFQKHEDSFTSEEIKKIDDMIVELL